MDLTSALLAQTGMRASTFHSGSYCSVTAFDDDAAHGHLHLLRQGRLTIALGDGGQLRLEQPTLVFFPGPCAHSVIARRQDKAELVCARLHYTGGLGNPLKAALPPYLAVPLAQAPMLADILDWLFREAAGDAYGRLAATDRLFELLVIQLLRHLLRQATLLPGGLAGLADARIARALDAIHRQPEQTCSVPELARLAAMSRASFAARFKQLVGQTPADYLTGWRITLAQKRLREGAPISAVAAQVGYESPSALARAFRRRTGLSPRDWLARADVPD
ncbi:AraC family transcriptional regulator [Duganella callida]|uniref:AraC family transcriptional regulator n=1 Tax=Duganella callida TaxID=2561932 RepID=A0A4Y9SLG6_9BURK|nr:AraC family transcriptional regulator [Duganella callida]TFW24325.1 AraC family transcriptional regulator [Duganella callida]